MIYKLPTIQLTDEDTCDFVLWAPLAGEASVQIAGGGEFKMQKEEGGYWSKKLDDIKTGTLYKYRIDGGDSFPDPASLSQPHGVHGGSEVIDLNQYQWNDSGWQNIPLSEMIIYELHTGTFTTEGTFDGIAKQLDYLIELGINTIEIMPVAQFPGKRNWGYDGVYPYAVQNSYGGSYELMKLVDKCHGKGIAVILDVVYNHFGPEGNYAVNFAPYFSEIYSTPWGHPINFDGKYSDGVRNFFIQNALMWLRDFHIDGLRIDAIHSIFDFSSKHILQEIAEKADELSKKTGVNYHLIAESHLNDVKYINSADKGGYGLDAQWSEDFHHSVHAKITGERNGYYADYGGMELIAKSVKESFAYDNKYSEYRKRTFGTSAQDNPGEQFVVFLQNHDMAGNRRFGERLSSLVSFEMLKTATALMFCTPNIPMLFMGEEYAEKNPFYYFISHGDNQLNEAVRAGRDNEFRGFYGDNPPPAPEPAALDTFEKSKLSFAFRTDRQSRVMLDFYKEMIRLRKSNPVLAVPNKERLSIHSEGDLLIMERWKDENVLLCLFNLGIEDSSYKISGKYSGGMHKIIDSASEKWLGKGSGAGENIKEGDEIKIKNESVLIYSK